MFLRLSLDQLYEKLKNKKEIEEIKYDFYLINEYDETNFFQHIKRNNDIIYVKTTNIEFIKYTCGLELMEAIKLFFKIYDNYYITIDNIIIHDYLMKNNLIKNNL